MRSFKHHHLTALGEKGQGLYYSPGLDKVFCLDCAFFTPPTHKDHYKNVSWTETGVDDWKRISEKMQEHIRSQNHVCCSLERYNFLKVQEGYVGTLETSFNSQRQKLKETNSEILSGCIHVTKLLGTQGLAFRGHSESYDASNDDGNHGNFLETMQMLGNFSNVIQENFNNHKEKKGSITMMSWKVQNDLINIIGM